MSRISFNVDPEFRRRQRIVRAENRSQNSLSAPPQQPNSVRPILFIAALCGIAYGIMYAVYPQL